MPEWNEIPKLHPAAGRLTRLQENPECVCYIKHEELDRRRKLKVTVRGIPSAHEIILEVTDWKITRVGSFTSRLKDPTVDHRAGLSLVDLADSFSLARQLSRHWDRVMPGYNLTPPSDQPHST